LRERREGSLNYFLEKQKKGGEKEEDFKGLQWRKMQGYAFWVQDKNFWKIRRL